MACLYLTESEVNSLLDMPAVIDLMDRAFRALGEGTASYVPRFRVRGDGVILHSMSGSAQYAGVLGWKQYTTTRHGARFHVGLYDQATGELTALIQANRLGQLRTGAVSGLAVRCLTPDRVPARVAVLGSGFQAETQLEAIAAVRPLSAVRVYSRDAERRTSFAQRMAQRLAVPVEASHDARQAVASATLVITATTSAQPVVAAEALPQDVLVCAVGSNWPQKRELDRTTVSRAQLVVCDGVAACRQEAGELLQAAEEGSWNWERAVELSDIVRGAVTAHRHGLILFKSVGLALEDVAVAEYVVRRARAAGLGRELPVE